MRRARAIGGAAVVAAGALGFACSGEVDPASAPDGSAPDAAADSYVAPAPDAGADASDASFADAADGDSGRPDGGAYCATLSPKPSFCDDFDGLDLGLAWDQRLVVTGAELGKDGASVTSGALALLTKSKSTAAVEPVGAFVRKTVTSTPTQVRFGFAMRPESDPPPTGNLWYATLDLSINHLLTFYLHDAAGGPALVEQATGIDLRTPLALPPKDAWTRVEIECDLTGRKITVKYDGAVVASTSLGTEAQDPTIRLGVLGNGPADRYVVRFDDVVLDAK